jgi:hypothetical protein
LLQSSYAQTRQLTKAGCKKVFREVHVSGAKTDRAQLRRLLDQLEADDVLMVTRLDRLARSTRDLLNIQRSRSSRPAIPLRNRISCLQYAPRFCTKKGHFFQSSNFGS